MRTDILPGATPRTPLQHLLDGLITRLLRLSAPTTDYTVTRDLRIPARDGVELLADMYEPTVPSFGTLLVRSPYGWPAGLSEVDPDGRSRNVSEGFVRLDPDTATGTTQLELDAVAHRCAAGNRIRVVIAGGSHPRWERNLDTDDHPATSARMVSSR